MVLIITQPHPQIGPTKIADGTLSYPKFQLLVLISHFFSETNARSIKCRNECIEAVLHSPYNILTC